ncbi:hypothetical protein Drorol1_Dr00003380, partial [Drosera rotundifolia]
ATKSQTCSKPIKEHNPYRQTNQNPSQIINQKNQNTPKQNASKNHPITRNQAQPRIRSERKNNNPTKIRENPILNQQSYFTQTQQYEKSRFEIGPSPSLSNRLNASLNSEICSSVN